MNIEKMRKEFEAWAVTRRNKYDLPFFVFARNEDGSYTDGTAEYAWEGWQASRESLVIELPDPSQTLAGPSLYAQFKEAVEASGAKVEVSP